MAADGSTSVTSDELFDYLCSQCNKKGRKSEAVKYCVVCQEYLCVTCVKSHNNFSILAGHTVVGRSKFGNASGADTKHLPSVPTERCKVHSMKLVDMYCADHDSVGCHVCLTINHKPCQGIHYIPEYVHTIPQTENIRKIKGEVEKEISEMGEIMKKTKKDISDYKKTKESYLEDIRVFRIEINETLDRLEQAAVSEVNETYGSLARDSQDELENIEDMLRKLTTCKSEMDSSQRNISHQFVHIHLCKNLISEIRKKITKSRDAEIYNITYERNSEILRCLQGFGSLVKQASPRKQSLYKVQSKKCYVKMDTDKRECDFWSSCILDSGEILLADYNNQNIKLIDHETYKVRNSMKMSSTPRSVCKINSTEAAVSCTNRTVQFVSTKNQLVPTRSLKFKHDCRGIALIDDQLVICEDGGKKAYIYTMNGERIKMIDKDQIGNGIFSYIREVCVSDDFKKLHVTDSDRGLITIDLDGNVIWSYTGPELKSAWGVCTDGHGNVFVSCKYSVNIVQLGSDGKLLGEVVSTADGLKCPLAVSFDKNKRKLLVADGNKLHVFQLE